MILSLPSLPGFLHPLFVINKLVRECEGVDQIFLASSGCEQSRLVLESMIAV